MNRSSFATLACATVLALAGAGSAQALTTLTGTVGDSGKYLLSAIPVSVTTNAVLKMTFETTTAGANLELCAGSGEDLTAGKCTTRLNDSGGPGFMFLTIVDAASLNGKLIYVLRAVGVNAASFRFTIE